MEFPGVVENPEKTVKFCHQLCRWLNRVQFAHQAPWAYRAKLDQKGKF